MRIISYVVDTSGNIRVLKCHDTLPDDTSPQDAANEIDRIWKAIQGHSKQWTPFVGRYGRPYAKDIRLRRTFRANKRLKNTFLGFEIGDESFEGQAILFTCTDCGRLWGKRRLQGPIPNRCPSCKLIATIRQKRDNMRRYRQQTSVK